MDDNTLDLSDHGNLYDEHLEVVEKLQAALEEKEKENEELKNRLSAMHAFDPDGDWPSYGELALMYAEQEKANEKLLKLHEIACDDAEAEITRLELENDELSTQLTGAKETAKDKEEIYTELSSIHKDIREENVRLSGLLEETQAAWLKENEMRLDYEDLLKEAREELEMFQTSYGRVKKAGKP